MRIQHNIAALNSYRNLTNNNSAVSKNLEKLSSGYKINRAGDDAAGLAISEKMRAQITGLETAQKNANDGISLVQTAEGALTEVHSMLNRMVELANQSANGTYDDKDREQLQKEIVSLKDEIDRISEGTNFNGINLLDGSLGSTSGAKVAVNVKVNAIDKNTDILKLNKAEAPSYKFNVDGTKSSTGDEVELTIHYTDVAGKEHSETISYKASDNSASADDTPLSDALNELFGADEYTVAVSSGAVTITAKEPGASNQFTLKGVTAKVNGADASDVVTGLIPDTAGADAYYSLKTNQLKAYEGTGNAEDFIFEINGQKFAFATEDGIKKLAPDVNYIKTGAATPTTDTASGVNETAAMVELINSKTGIGAVQNSVTAANIDLKAGTKAAGSGNGLTLQIGDTAESFNQLTVSVGNMASSSLGIGGLDISTQTGAKNAVGAIKAAINSVSSTRGDLGAIQNRLEHTINNLSVTTENMTAAESRIRDVDMANEMMAYTKNNILVQSSQAMLAQANQIPQGVLQLLQ